MIFTILFETFSIIFAAVKEELVQNYKKRLAKFILEVKW